MCALMQNDPRLAANLAEFLKLPCSAEFIDMELTDGGLSLVCEKKTPAKPEIKHVPSYDFAVTLGGRRVGGASLRIGFVESLYYGGNIGYNIDAEYRGRGLAGRAVLLLKPLLLAHGMTRAYITNDVNNAPSRRVCEKLALTLECAVQLPECDDLYKNGSRFVNVFRWEL